MLGISWMGKTIHSFLLLFIRTAHQYKKERETMCGPMKGKKKRQRIMCVHAITGPTFPCPCLFIGASKGVAAHKFFGLSLNFSSYPRLGACHQELLIKELIAPSHWITKKNKDGWVSVFVFLFLIGQSINDQGIRLAITEKESRTAAQRLTRTQ